MLEQTKIQPDRTRAICDIFAKAFDRPGIDPDADFFELGGDSLIAERIATDLSGLLGHDMRISLLFDHPTPEALAEHLSATTPQTAPRTDTRPPIFTIHGASGYTVPKPAFFEGLADDQRLDLLQMPGRTGHDPIPETVPDLARIYADQIEQDWPTGALYIAAFCNGAFIAVELAHEFARRGRRIDHMVLLDPGVPKNLGALNAGRHPSLIERLAHLPVTGRVTGGLTVEDVMDPRLRRARRQLYRTEKRLRTLRDRILSRADVPEPASVLEARSALHAALRHHWPEPYTGTVDLLCSEQLAPLHTDPGSLWRRLTPKARIKVVSTAHKEMTGATSPAPAREMQRCFDASAANAP